MDEIIIRLNKDRLAQYLRGHLNCFYGQTITPDLIAKLIEYIIDSFDDFVNSSGE